MPYDFEADLRITAAFRARTPRTPLKLSLTFADYPDVQTRAEVTPLGKEQPGVARVLILAQRFFAGRLRAEMVFDGYVGGEAVARGIVTAVANEALRLPVGTHPDSVNLLRYPSDISAFIDEEYGVRAALVRQQLQVLLGERPDCRLPRIVRAILWLGARDSTDLEAFDAAEDLARSDYRDLLRAAEYTPGPPERQVRDLARGFPERGT